MLQVMKLSLAVFRLPIASRSKKNNVLARHKGWGGGGKECFGCLLYQRFHVSFLNLFCQRFIKVARMDFLGLIPRKFEH